MAKNKIKRGEDWIDYDLLNNNINAAWSDYITDYDFGKDFNFDLMSKYRDLILEGIRDGYITYNPTSESKYLYTLNKNIPEFNLKSNELKYAAGLIGLYLRNAQAIQEDPWNSNTYHQDLLKSGYFKGQDPDYTLLTALDQNLKTAAYKDILNSFITGIESVPEDLREDYLNFYNRASGFMDNNTLTPDELLDLKRYTGLDWGWTKNIEKESVLKELPVDKESSTFKLEAFKLKETEKEHTVNYEDYADLSNVDKNKVGTHLNNIKSLSSQAFGLLYSKILSHPDLYSDLLMAAIVYLSGKTNQKEGMLELPGSSGSYKYFYDFTNKKVVKANKNNFAVHKNVESEKEEKS